jgi:hypothetical protein
MRDCGSRQPIDQCFTTCAPDGSFATYFNSRNATAHCHSLYPTPNCFDFGQLGHCKKLVNCVFAMQRVASNLGSQLLSNFL